MYLLNINYNYRIQLIWITFDTRSWTGVKLIVNSWIWPWNPPTFIIWSRLYDFGMHEKKLILWKPSSIRNIPRVLYIAIKIICHCSIYKIIYIKYKTINIYKKKIFLTSSLVSWIKTKVQPAIWDKSTIFPFWRNNFIKSHIDPLQSFSKR